MAKYKFSQSSINNMRGVDPQLVKVAYEALKISRIDFGIPSTGGLRTSDEQNQLYIDGKSKCDGYSKKSLHQTGQALDFFAYVNGKGSWDREHLAMVACAFQQAAIQLGTPIKVGGLFKNFEDWPHVELVD